MNLDPLIWAAETYAALAAAYALGGLTAFVLLTRRCVSCRRTHREIQRTQERP